MKRTKLIKLLNSLADEPAGPVRSGLADDIKQQIPPEIKSAALNTNIFGMAIRSKFMRVAAAAVIIVGIGFFIRINRPAERIDDTAFVAAGKTPAEMLSLAALNIAYRKGGMEAVEKQYEKAFNRTGPRPVKLTVEDLFMELNGG